MHVETIKRFLYFYTFTGGWGNKKSAIRDKKQGELLVEKQHTPLHPKRQRSFWIRWGQDVIHVGKGTNEFMKYKAPSHTEVNYIGISTGFGATGEWTLYV